MTINYQNQTETILQSFQHKHSLLLHVCCAPCASYVIEYLFPYFNISLFYYNPNTRPHEEYIKRLNNVNILLENNKDKKIPLIVPDYDSDSFEKIYSGRENIPEGGTRCTDCFRLRLSKTAEYASVNSFDYFCTTLSISPHKNAELLNSIGNQYAEKFNVKWLPSDFKKLDGYKKSIELSKKYHLYRQNYCGCTPSQE